MLLATVKRPQTSTADCPRKRDCAKCGGLLKPNTISFGQSLVEEDLERARDLALSCDMMIAAGSTLLVQPAASFPALAKQNGAVLAIITQSETPLDSSADFVFHEKLGDFIDRLGDRIKKNS